MKKTKVIRLVFLGGFSAGAMAVGAPMGEPRISPASVYTNDYFVAGAGYYHAPFHAFFPRPYNFFDPQKKLYFYGGTWGATPHRSIINISAPTLQAAQLAEAGRIADHQRSIQRGGFGSTSGSHHIWS